MAEVIVNKVAESGLISLDLEKYYPITPRKVFDLKDHLFMGLILKEKDYRAALSATDWNEYKDTDVAITCSADAVIPMWAYMLAASYLEPVANSVVFGTEQELIHQQLMKNIEAIDVNEFADQRIVIKGCGDIAIPEAAYVAITKKLRPVAKSIMYGEPCSTVPIFKQQKK